MKSVYSLSLIIYFHLIIISPCENEKIEVSTTPNEKSYNLPENIKEFEVNISLDCKENYKFIRIIATPISNKALLYLSLTQRNPDQNNFDLSAADGDTNQIYVPRTYFEKIQTKSFFMSAYCDQNCNFNISFQLVEMMYAEKSIRLDFPTFDNEEYLIYFNGNETDKNSRLMVTAAGGGKSQHGTKNNVELTLTYIPDNGSNAIIEVNNNIMFNGAGATFSEEEYQKLGKGHYLARVKAPINTYISFMVRQINVVSDLFIDGKAIYGFLQGEEIDKFELKNIKNDNPGTDNENRTFQVSILAKGDLNITQSSNPDCAQEFLKKNSLTVKDEYHALFNFTSDDLSKNIKYICIQGTRVNAYIIEVHDVTDQKIQTIVTEPLVNGYIYTDKLKLDEVRSYRQSKYITEYSTKYNCRLIEGNIKVALVECLTFPNCQLTKKIIEEGHNTDGTIYAEVLLDKIDNYYIVTVDKILEKNVYDPHQYLLAVVCLTKECYYEISFSDEDDSLILREDSRVAHHIYPNLTNYYHFKISDIENAQKVYVYLRTISGDTKIDVLDDAMERKRYFFENTEILEFYGYEFTGLYTLNVSGNINSFYLLTYSILRNNETEENKIHDIGKGISFISSIKNGHKYKKFKISIDKTKAEILNYLTIFYPINCDIDAYYNNTEINSTNRIFQHSKQINTSEYEGNYLEYQVKDKSFNNESSYENKLCLFHVMAQEVSKNTESIISEGTNINFILSNKTDKIGFIYPHAAGEKDILIKYNLENNYLVKMKIRIEASNETELKFSRSSSYVINASYLNESCLDISKVCSINIHFEADITSQNISIPMSFMIKSDDITPSSLAKNKFQLDIVAEKTVQYYMVELNPEDKGQIVLNFKKGSGIMFAKIVGKEADPEENPDWNNRVRLPKEGEKAESVGEFDPYRNTIEYDAKKLYKYGKPVCSNGCELYIGVISTDVISGNQTDYLEYSIYIRPEMFTESPIEEERQKLIKNVMVDILANEYVTGYIKNSSDIHYYIFDVPIDCDLIEVELLTESCTLYIKKGDKFPIFDDDDQVDQWEVIPTISSVLKSLKKKEDLHVDTLKGVEFRIAVKAKNYDELMSMMYSFRIKTIKNETMKITEINGNLATVCEPKEIESESESKSEKYCYLIYPVSDYEFKSKSILSIYAEPDVFSDVYIFFNPIKSYELDLKTDKEIWEILPRKSGNSKKSTESSTIKNYLEITPDDLNIEENVKSYALISIKSNRPVIIKIYTNMRQQVKKTALNPYSNLLFDRKYDDEIKFITKGDQAYNFYIACIKGEANAYFENEGKNIKISGDGTQFTLTLQKNKNDTLIIKPTSESGITFYIAENIHPEVRPMELIKYCYSGMIDYSEQNIVNSPMIFYMKISQKEAVNFIININNIKTNFNPKDDGNLTEVFDMTGYVVDENMIRTMMRSKRKNPPKKNEVLGKYDKSLTMAKIYFPSGQVEKNQYLLIYFNKNQHMESEVKSLAMTVSAIPLNSISYTYPKDIYISGNLIKGVTSPECHHHLLRRGKEDDKYMQIELGILSSYIKYDIQDNNGNSFLTEMTFKNGKYSGIIKMLNNTDLKLSFCKNESIFYKAKQESLNYIFKFKTKADDDFTNYILENNNVSSEYEENQNSVVLNIPKVLYQNGSKTIAAPGVYYIRLYPNLTLDTKDNLSTISFISYYAYGTYNYTIYENETNTDNISYTLNNFPKDQDYIVSIIAVIKNGTNEEIFAYNQINNPVGKQTKEEEKKNKTNIILLGVFLGIGAILVGIAIYFFVRMFKKKKQLDDELSKLISVETKEDDHESKKDILL